MSELGWLPSNFAMPSPAADFQGRHAPRGPPSPAADFQGCHAPRLPQPQCSHELATKSGRHPSKSGRHPHRPACQGHQGGCQGSLRTYAWPRQQGLSWPPRSLPAPMYGAQDELHTTGISAVWALTEQPLNLHAPVDAAPQSACPGQIACRSQCRYACIPGTMIPLHKLQQIHGRGSKPRGQTSAAKETSVWRRHRGRAASAALCSLAVHQSMTRQQYPDQKKLVCKEENSRGRTWGRRAMGETIRKEGWEESCRALVTPVMLLWQLVIQNKNWRASLKVGTYLRLLLKRVPDHKMSSACTSARCMCSLTIKDQQNACACLFCNTLQLQSQLFTTCGTKVKQ